MSANGPQPIDEKPKEPSSIWLGLATWGIAAGGFAAIVAATYLGLRNGAAKGAYLGMLDRALTINLVETDEDGNETTTQIG
jgi:hypothetical protein